MLLVPGRIRAAYVVASIAVVAAFSPIQAQERWQFREELRIGAADGYYALTQISSAQASPDASRIFVAQPQEHRIRVFDAHTGTEVGSIGRRGNGPGEFQVIGRLGWKQDTLYATDLAQQRMSLFTSAGTHVRTVLAASDALPSLQVRAFGRAFAANGTIWAEPRWVPAQIAMGRITEMPTVHMEPNGKVLGVIARRDVRNMWSAVDLGTQVAIWRQPLIDRSFVDFAPDGSSVVVVEAPLDGGQAAEIVVTRISPAADTIYSRLFSYDPKPVPASVRDSIYRHYAAGLRNLSSGAALEAVRKYIAVPATQPPITAVLLDSAGQVWLRRETVQVDRAIWVVLDKTGMPIATIMLDPSVRLLSIVQEFAWGVVHDEFDTPYLIRYRIVRP